MKPSMGKWTSSILLTLLFFTLTPLFGQTENKESTQRLDQEPIALTASEVASEAEETAAFLNAAVLGSQPRTATITIEKRLPQIEFETRRLVAKTDDELNAHLSLEEFGDLRNRLARQDRLLRDLRDQIREQSTRLDQFLEQIRDRRTIWVLTREAGQSKEYPEAAMALIRETLADLDKGQQEIGERRGQLLALQNSIVELRTLVNESTNRAATAEQERLSLLFSFGGPAVWEISRLDSAEAWARFREQMIRKFASLRDFASERLHWIGLSILLILLLALLLRKLRKRLPADLGNQNLVYGAKQSLEHPFASSILVILLFNFILNPNAPLAWYNALLLVALIALLRLLPGFVPVQLVSFAFVLILLRALDLVNSQLPEGTPFSRLLTFGVIVIAFVSLLRFNNRLKVMETISSNWRTGFTGASWTGYLLLSVALLSQLAGNAALAELLVSGTVRTAFLTLTLAVAFSVLLGIAALGLQSNAAMKSHLVRANRELILGKITRIVGAVMILILLVTVPSLFSVSEPVSSAVSETFTTPLVLGSFSVSLADLVAFIFVVWLSYQVARFVCFVLEEDFLPRLSLPRGVPAAISHLTRYSVLLLGFLIALTAGGFDVGRLTIMASAFGVGIGFGLQNVVNNFVSGLILLFERPVRVGDRIQLAQELTGEVTRIGIRASAVKTIDGADVLLPNGNLISNELTNWTLSDPKRRITIPVGVAYGTKPRRVLGLLKQVLEDNPEVLKKPEPVVLFMGFGESSLDFSLRFWVDHFDKGLPVRSDIAVAISDLLEENGIEIPFPQRVLHLRSFPHDFQVQTVNRQLEQGEGTVGVSPPQGPSLSQNPPADRSSP